jgi:hypothetical protein
MHAPIDLAPDQAGVLENVQVLGDGRSRHLEWGSELAYRRLPGREALKDGPSGRIGQGSKDPIELSPSINRSVNH